MSIDERRSQPRTGRAAPAGAHAAPEPRTGASSWLFIRDQESIWIERPFGLSMIIVGPGSTRAHLHFMDENAVEAYQVATAERLSRGGWFLWGFDRDRRQHGERRADRTTEPERRHPAGDRRRPSQPQPRA